jgi:hypothetical protein
MLLAGKDGKNKVQFKLTMRVQNVHYFRAYLYIPITT